MAVNVTTRHPREPSTLDSRSGSAQLSVLRPAVDSLTNTPSRYSPSWHVLSRIFSHYRNILPRCNNVSQRPRYASFSCYVYWLICLTWPSRLRVTALNHILDDDSLLNIFYLYRPFLLRKDEDENDRLAGGQGGRVRGRLWYNLAQVRQSWQNTRLGSASHLGVSLVCTNK